MKGQDHSTRRSSPSGVDQPAAPAATRSEAAEGGGNQPPERPRSGAVSTRPPSGALLPVKDKLVPHPQQPGGQVVPLHSQQSGAQVQPGGQVAQPQPRQLGGQVGQQHPQQSGGQVGQPQPQGVQLLPRQHDEPEVITVDLPDLSSLPEQPRSLGRLHCQPAC
jgi:hypothetical protein